MTEAAQKTPLHIAPRTTAPKTWQQALADAVTNVPDLLAAVGLSDRADELCAKPSARFPLRVPRGFIARMRHGDANDPLLRQVLPSSAEDLPVTGFGPDPVGDLASEHCSGLLQKYQGRALLITTGACAVHCRYCFRRDYPYGDSAITHSKLDAVLEHVASDRSIRELILSGGDPLSLSDDRLRQLLKRIGEIGHVERIRIHTRQPIVLPERIDADLCATLENAPRPLVIVIHCNHANEIDATVTPALQRLAACSQALLNQSVLLRGVNDSTPALVELSETLFASGVLPYYLHQLDPVTGAAHFAVTDAMARQLVREAAHQLPGYLVPKLVRELPGEAAKTPV